MNTDIQKDSPREEGIAAFVSKQSGKTSPFGENRVGERAYRRAERLSSAIFLLTNHIPNREPVRIESRALALQLLSSVLDLRDEMRARHSEAAHTFKALVRQLISVVRLLGISGYCSLQNAESVSEALDDLASFLSASQRSTLSESVSFSKEYLLDARESGQQRNLISDRPAYTSIKDTILTRDETSSRMDSVPRIVPRSSEMDVRSMAIIEVLRVGGEMGIRDVASNLPEYSEKMIQRELANLVHASRVKKVGLKRWSRYSLVS